MSEVFVPPHHEPLPADIQRQIDLANNSIALLNADIRRLQEFKMRLENEVSSLDKMVAERKEILASTNNAEDIVKNKIADLESGFSTKLAEFEVLKADLKLLEADKSSLMAFLTMIRAEKAQIEADCKKMTSETAEKKKEWENLREKITIATQELKKLASL